MMMFLGLAAMNTQANLLFGVFGLMIGILVVSGFISRAMLRKLKIHRNLPEHGIVGETMSIGYEITNTKRHWPSFSIAMSELDGVEAFDGPPQCYVLHIAPGMTAAVPVELIPWRRGVFELDHFQLGTSFPFGFIKRATVDRHKDSICIFPPIAEVDRQLLALCRSADNIGESVLPRAGGMDEFYGLREYRAGDNPRNIYWRRSARTGVLVAKEMMRVSPPRMQILVDTHLANPTPQALCEVERTIAMAASLASMAMAQELAVGICAWAGEPITIAPTRGKQHREELLTLLARLCDNPVFTGADLLRDAQWMLQQGTTLVILTPGRFDVPLPEHSRGGVLVLSAASEKTRSWFRFRAGVGFQAALNSVKGDKVS
jgi:uncharacterized protein (DUF58 family)